MYKDEECEATGTADPLIHTYILLSSLLVLGKLYVIVTIVFKLVTSTVQ